MRRMSQIEENNHPANAAQSSVFRAAFWKWPSDGADMYIILEDYLHRWTLDP